ncbi:MAG: protein kinase, partial [Planctomycetes bacterium]|nr:protein kinase [Planctomycetota bacterium]
MNRPQAGDRINNYLLDERVGAGAFSEVFKAHHHVFGDVVAVKIPTDPQYVRYLQRDGVAIHGLRHPNIVRALDLDPYGDPAYLIMEFVDGPSLRQVIDAHPGGLPVATVLPIMMGILSALEAAHAAGLVHS